MRYWKCRVRVKLHRGFQSHPLRLNKSLSTGLRHEGVGPFLLFLETSLKGSILDGRGLSLRLGSYQRHRTSWTGVAKFPGQSGVDK
jgi:hypothetical protein